MKEVPHYVTESGRHFSTPEEAERCERLEDLAKNIERLLPGGVLYADPGITEHYGEFGEDWSRGSKDVRLVNIEKILACLEKHYTITPIPPPLP